MITGTKSPKKEKKAPDKYIAQRVVQLRTEDSVKLTEGQHLKPKPEEKIGTSPLKPK